jgi:hypothetical protein
LGRVGLERIVLEGATAKAGDISRRRAMGGRVEVPKKDEVDRAVAAARKAVGRLVALLGEEDLAVVGKAAVALEGIGAFAVGPLAAALPRARPPRHRVAIARALIRVAPRARVEVVEALDAAMGREANPAAWAVLASGRMHALAGAVAEMLEAQRR